MLLRVNGLSLPACGQRKANGETKSGGGSFQEKRRRRMQLICSYSSSSRSLLKLSRQWAMNQSSSGRCISLSACRV